MVVQGTAENEINIELAPFSLVVVLRALNVMSFSRWCALFQSPITMWIKFKKPSAHYYLWIK